MKVSLEMDSLLIVKTVNKDELPASYLGYIAADIRALPSNRYYK